MALAVEKIKTPTSLAEMAYTAIKESILRTNVYEMPDDGRLDERRLATSLGISRTPLRDAINRLVAEGFLRSVPRKGVYVVRHSKAELIEVLWVRAALESMGARLAALRATEEEITRMRALFAPFDPEDLARHMREYSEANVRFHEMVLRASRCGKLIEMANNVFEHIQMIRLRTITFVGRPRKSYREHTALIDALERRDADGAERVMRQHIEDLVRHVEENVESLP